MALLYILLVSLSLEVISSATIPVTDGYNTSCVFSGVTYHGSFQLGPCMYCSCVRSVPRCALQDCAPRACKYVVHDPDECCSSCATGTLLHSSKYWMLKIGDKNRGACRNVARNFAKMKPANRIFEISAEAQHFLHDCIYAKRSSKKVWLISAKQWLWSACAFAQADQSHCLADMWSCRKCCGPAHLMSSEQVLGENKVNLQNLCWSPGFIASAWLRAWHVSHDIDTLTCTWFCRLTRIPSNITVTWCCFW